MTMRVENRTDLIGRSCTFVHMGWLRRPVVHRSVVAVPAALHGR